MAYEQRGNPFKKRKDDNMVQASNGAMVPKSDLEIYEQSIKQARKELAKERIAKNYKSTMFNPVFKEVATAALFAPLQAFNIGKKIVSYGTKLNRLSRAKRTARGVDAVDDANQVKNSLRKK